MANRKLIHDLDVSEIDVLLEEDFSSAMETWILQANTVYEPNKIVEGRVREIRGEDVVIDVGYKSEGLIRLDEWKEDGDAAPNYPKVGDTVQGMRIFVQQCEVSLATADAFEQAEQALQRFIRAAS